MLAEKRMLQAAQIFTLLIPPLSYVGKAPMDIACSLVAVLFLIYVVRKKETDWLRHPWVLACFALWGYMVINSLFQDSALLSLSRAAAWLRYPFFAAALAFWVIDDKAFYKKLLISALIGCSFFVVDGALQFITGENLFGKHAVISTRISGPFDMPRLGYTLTWIAFPVLALCMCWKDADKRVVLAKVATFCAIMFTVFISGDRTPLIMLIIFLTGIAVFSPDLRRRLLYVVPVIAVAAAAMIHFVPSLYERHIGHTSSQVMNFWDSPYGKITLDSKEIFMENPVLGIGMKAYREASAKKREPQPHPHNFYLQIAVELGGLGLLFFCIMIAIFAKDVFFNYSLWKQDYLMMGLGLAMLVRFWPFVSEPSFYSSWSVVPLWLCVGWWYAMFYRKRMLEHSSERVG